MTRIEYAAEHKPSFLARWASRIALFCVMLLVVTVILHRLFGLATPIAINMALSAFAGAAVVLVMAAIAGLDIWITGRQGAARIIFGTILALFVLAIPAMVWTVSREWPAINDITTNPAKPPEFTEISKLRDPGSNPAAYPGEAFAKLQQASYPDLKTLAVERASEETFELVLQALAKLRYKTTSEVPPAAASDGAGTVELSERTMVFGFIDDIVIRVSGDENISYIDVRSASRYGQNDFGANAARIRTILKEIVGRLEATVPSAEKRAAQAAKKSEKPIVKRPQGRDRPSAGNRQKANPSRSGTRRAPEPSE